MFLYVNLQNIFFIIFGKDDVFKETFGTFCLFLIKKNKSERIVFQNADDFK
jgi:hypothetical protein